MGSDSIDGDGPSGGPSPDEDQAGPPPGASELAIMPAPPQAQPRKPQKSSFLDRAVGRLASALFSGKPHPHFTGKTPNLPAFRVLAVETQRVRSMGRAETALLVGVDHQVYTRIGAVRPC